MEQKAESLMVHLFGRFSMTYGENDIYMGKTTTKPFRLLQILLYAGNEGISRSKLMEELFGLETEVDISNNLGVVVYQLRKFLKSSGLPEENYIVTWNGRYRFVSSFPVIVDVEEFEELNRKAEKAEGSRRLELRKKAFELYGGHFLSELAGIDWVTVAGANYQHQYFECVEDLCRALTKQERPRELYPICSRAAELYPYDEWQVWQMECLIAMGHLEEAMELYEKTAAMYLDELDVQPPERMRECFCQMGGSLNRQIEDLSEIQEKLKEDHKKGAYYCSYLSFVDAYHIMERYITRSGQSIYLMLCTIMYDGDKPASLKKRQKQTAEKMAEAIEEALRSGDIYTQYNRCQFLVILLGIQKEDFSNVISRLDGNFRKREGSRAIHVSYRVASIANASDGDRNFHFTFR